MEGAIDGELSAAPGAEAVDTKGLLVRASNPEAARASTAQHMRDGSLGNPLGLSLNDWNRPPPLPRENHYDSNDGTSSDSDFSVSP